MKMIKKFLSAIVVLCMLPMAIGIIPAQAMPKQIQEDWFVEIERDYLNKEKALYLGGNQCVALSNHYMQKIFGVAWNKIYSAWYAKDIYAAASGAYFEKIPQTPEGIPQKGDIIVFKASINGGAGHIAVVESANINTITVIEQNGPSGRWVKRYTYKNYAHVLGWLRPRAEKVVGGYPIPPVVATTLPKQQFYERSDEHILNGEYYIVPYSHTGKVLAAWDGNTNNGQDVIYYQFANASNYKWKFERQDDDSFIITNSQSGKVLDVPASQIGNNVKIQLWDRLGGENQRWYIHRFDDGSYRIIAKHSGYSLSLPENHNSINMNQYYRDMGLSQRFFLFSTTPQGQVPNSSANEIKDGEYRIKSSLDNKKYISVEANNKGNSNVFINSKTGTNEQKWKLERQTDGSFKIISVESNKVLDLNVNNIGYFGTNRTNITTESWHGNLNQRWYIVSVGNGLYKIVSKQNGYNLDIDGANTQDKTNIQLYIDNGHKAQQFYLENVNSTSQTKPEPRPQPTGATITVQSLTGAPNSEIIVPITLSNNPGIASMKIQLDYDRTKLELLSSEITEAFKNLQGVNVFEGNDYPVIFNWILVDNNSNENGTFAKLKFRIKEGAPIDQTEIKLTYDSEDIFNQDLINVLFNVVNSKINISNRKQGDFDGDGRVNNKDAIMLFKYISTGKAGSINISLFDLDKNGSVNNRDSIKLFRFISGSGTL